MLCLFVLQLLDEQILCVHGGLSPDIKTLDQIRTIERNQEIPHKGAFCDLVWSDPEDVDTWAISPRGAGWLFGAKVTNEVNDVIADKKKLHFFNLPPEFCHNISQCQPYFFCSLLSSVNMLISNLSRDWRFNFMLSAGVL